MVAYVKHELERCTEWEWGEDVTIRYPVFIGVDDYNALYGYSLFEYRNQP